MDISRCSVSPPFHYREATLNLAYCMQFENWPRQKLPDLNYKSVLRCCQKLLPTFLIHLIEGMKHFSSNVCLSLQGINSICHDERAPQI